eukprot:scaffold75777_cov36-Phaeocystis_antarctica.AAC.1
MKRRMPSLSISLEHAWSTSAGKRDEWLSVPIHSGRCSAGRPRHQLHLLKRVHLCADRLQPLQHRLLGLHAVVGLPHETVPALLVEIVDLAVEALRPRRRVEAVGEGARKVVTRHEAAEREAHADRACLAILRAAALERLACDAPRLGARPLVVGVERLRHLVHPEHGARVFDVAGLRVDLPNALERRADAVLAEEVLLDGALVLLLRSGRIRRAHLLALDLWVPRLKAREPGEVHLGVGDGHKTLLIRRQSDEASRMLAPFVVEPARLEHEHDLLADLGVCCRVLTASRAHGPLGELWLGRLNHTCRPRAACSGRPMHIPADGGSRQGITASSEPSLLQLCGLERRRRRARA